MCRVLPARPSGVYPLFLLLALGLSASAPLRAQTGALKAKDDTIAIRFGATSAAIPANKFLLNDDMIPGTEWVLVQAARHGDLTLVDGGLIYFPSPDFWNLGLDSMIYSLVGPNAERSTATVNFHLKDVLDLLYEEDFEDSGFQADFFTSGPANLVNIPSATIANAGSLEIQVDEAGQGYLEIAIGAEGGNTGGSSESNADSGQACGMIDDSEDYGAFQGERMVLIKLGKEGFGPADTSVQLVYSSDGVHRRVAAEVWDVYTGAFQPTAWVTLVSETPQVELTWYRNGDNVGAWVEADGRVEGPVEGYNPVPTLEFARIGMMPQGTVPQTSFLFDNVQIWRMKLRSAVSNAPLRISENFEDGGFDDLVSITGAGISVTPEAAITGDYGLKVDLQNGDSYVRSIWASADEEIAVRFQVDTADLSMASGEMFTFLATGANPLDFADLSLRLYLSRSDGQTRVASHIYQDDGTPVTLGWTEVPDRFEVLLRLRDSSSDASGNGFLQLWIDEEHHEVFHVPNGTRLLHWSQLGAHGVDAMTSGVLRIDDLTIWQ